MTYETSPQQRRFQQKPNENRFSWFHRVLATMHDINPHHDSPNSLWDFDDRGTMVVMAWDTTHFVELVLPGHEYSSKSRNHQLIPPFQLQSDQGELIHASYPGLVHDYYATFSMAAEDAIELINDRAFKRIFIANCFGKTVGTYDRNRVKQAEADQQGTRGYSEASGVWN